MREEYQRPPLNLMQSPSHPIINLPPELLSEIFGYALPETNPCTIEAPVNVSSVCKAWRQIAIDTPHLWSAVHIERCLHGMRLPSAHTIQTWISRSGGCGFSFSIPRMQVDETKFNAVIDVLLQNCEIWRKVHIAIENHYSEKLISLIPIRTPNLRKLSIYGHGFSFASLFNAPLVHLTHLHISSSTIYSPPSTTLLLENLISLNLMAVNHSDVIECLSRSPRLEEVSAYFDFTAEESRGLQVRICFKLEHLQHLDLVVDIRTCHQGQRGPFDHINLPSLKTMFFEVIAHDFENTNVGGDLLWDFSVNIVSRYKDSLVNLEMQVRCGTVPRPGFIDRFHRLKHLGVHVSVLNDEFIRALVNRFSSSARQPSKEYSCLESLLIFGFHEDVHEPTLSAIINLAEKEKSSVTFHPVIIVLRRPLILPPDSVVEIMGESDWMNRRRDLYRGVDW